MTDSPEELSTALRLAIEAERKAEPAFDPALAARLARSLQTLDALGPAPVDAAPALAHAGAPAGLLAKVLSVAVALAVGGVGGWYLRGPPPPPQLIERVVRVEVPAPPREPPPAIAVAEPQPVRPTRPERRAPSPSPGTPVAAPPQPAPSPLAEVERPDDAMLARERTLIDMARSAMVQDRPQAALEAVESHAAQFPSGVLHEEREALRVRALVRLGRLDEARRALEALERRWPGSVYLGPLKKALP